MSLLSATVRQTAVRPQYLHLALRTYSGVACTKYNPASQAKKSYTLTSKHPISSTHQNQNTEYFPAPKTPNVKEVQTAWTHPVCAFSHPIRLEKEADRNLATPRPKCKISVLHTERRQIGQIGLLWELCASSDGAWTLRQDTNTPNLTKSFQLCSK